MNTALLSDRLCPEDLVRIADNVPHLVWVSDNQGTVQWCNRPFCDYLCQPREKLMGKQWQEAIQPEARSQVWEKWQRALERNEAFDAEVRFRRAGSAAHLFLLRAVPQFESAQSQGATESRRISGWIFTGTDIEELRSLQREYHSILRSVPDVITRVGRDGKIISVSPNVEYHNDWSLESFVGKTPGDAPLWDNEPEYQRLLANVLAQGIEADFEYEHRARFYRARLLPEFNERGEVESVLSITEDITEARRIEAVATHHRELFESIGNATPGMIYLFDLRERRVTFVSGGVVGVMGYSPSQIQALDFQGFQQIIHPDDYPRLLHERKSLVASSGEVLENEHRVLHADGSWRWLHAREVLFARDISGTPRQILGVGIDITARRNTETALRDSEQRLRLTIDAVQLGTWDWFVNEERIIWNDWHWRLFGLEPGKPERKYEDFERYVHPDDRQMIADKLNATLRGEDSFHAEFRVLWPDGSQHWISGQGNVTEFDAHGKPSHMRGVIFDVTTRKEAEDALQQAHDELELRVKERTAQLQSTVLQLNAEIEQRRAAQDAHRHLLSRLVNMQEEERLRLSRELHDQFGQTLTAMLMAIDASTVSAQTAGEFPQAQERLRGMVADLMDQIHRRAWELRPASLDNIGLIAALRQLVTEWRGAEVDFVTRGFSETRLPPPLEIALYRVVQEALTNIARHANASRISVVLEKYDTHVIAIVEDNGQGFDLEHAGDERLGLLGMRERMDAVGGTLEVETSHGGGTSVFARVPLVSSRSTTEV